MIDFLKHLTPEQRERIRLREESEERRTVGKITATDTRGNVFEKTVILSEDLRVISFGWPTEYDLEQLYTNLDTTNCLKFCIDTRGLNHKGFEVTIPMTKVCPLLVKALVLRKRLQQEGEDRND